MKRMNLPCLFLTLISLLLNGCGALNISSPPTIAHGHVGQVLTISSRLPSGQSLLGHADSMVLNVQALKSGVLAYIDKNDFAAA